MYNQIMKKPSLYNKDIKIHQLLIEMSENIHAHLRWWKRPQKAVIVDKNHFKGHKNYNFFWCHCALFKYKYDANAKLVNSQIDT